MDEELEQAIKKCESYIRNNASITLTREVDDGIRFEQYNTSAIETVLYSLLELMQTKKLIMNSDRSKEISSMNYYNEMRVWKDRAKHYKNILDNVYEHIATSTECPFGSSVMNTEACNHVDFSICQQSKEKKLKCIKWYFEYLTSKGENKDEDIED